MDFRAGRLSVKANVERTYEMDGLAIPPAAVRDQEAIELARVWVAERGLHCSIKVGMYAEGGVAREINAWGIILADLVQHLTDALSGEGFGSKAALLEALVDAFNEEISAPTSDRTGGEGAKVS